MLKKSLTEKSYHENFPVATLFLRKNERDDILVLYQFARECDDIADNENFKVDQRKKILNEYQKNIKSIEDLIKESIEHTVRTALPVKEILRDHFEHSELGEQNKMEIQKYLYLKKILLYLKCNQEN